MKKYKTFGFLNNIRIPILLNVHDIQQNIRLLSPLGILNNGNKELKLAIYLSEDELQFGEEFLREKGITASDFIVGIHPGSSMEHGMSQKRFPKEKFAELCDAIIENYGCQILIFGGLDEESLKNDIANLMKNDSFVVPVMSLRQTAGIISKCNLFISNDSGLMHIAVAMNIPTIGIFGPTDHIRTAPYGKNCVVVRSKISCSPCWLLSEVGIRKECPYPQPRCLTELSISEILDVLPKCLIKEMPRQRNV